MNKLQLQKPHVHKHPLKSHLMSANKGDRKSLPKDKANF